MFLATNSSNKASAIKQKVHWIYQFFDKDDEDFSLKVEENKLNL